MVRPRLEDLLLAFATVDGILAVAVLTAARLPALAAAAGLAAVAALLLLRHTRREAWAWVLVLGLVVLPVAALVALRPPTAPVQDSVLLVDAAAGRLLHGWDPYGHDYVDAAALRAFWLPEMPVNPLLAHLPYPPGLLLLAVPLHLAGLSVAWLWPAGMIALAAAARWAAGTAGLVAVGLSPLLLLDGLALFSDLFFLAAALAAWALLRGRHGLLAGALAGLALCLKQPALVLAPALLALAWRERALVPFLAGGAAVVLALCLPFLAWDARAFLADTAAYFYGSGVDSFPIRGPGLGGALLAAGLVPSRWAAYPGLLLQLPVLAVIAVAGRRRLAAQPWLWSALFAAAAFGLGRTLAPNYVSVIGLLLSLGLAAHLDPLPGGARVEGPVERAPGHPRVAGGP